MTSPLFLPGTERKCPEHSSAVSLARRRSFDRIALWLAVAVTTVAYFLAAWFFVIEPGVG